MSNNRVVRSIDQLKTLELIFSLKQIPSLQTKYEELVSAGYRILVVDQRRGYHSRYDKVITIPAFALTMPEGYWIYYVAHEFAHTHGHHHDIVFMAEFKRICPIEYQYHELGYKPRNAAGAGIKKVKAASSDVKVIDILGLL